MWTEPYVLNKRVKWRDFEIYLLPLLWGWPWLLCTGTLPISKMADYFYFFGCVWCAGIQWKDPHVLLSTGKDSMLHQHIFQNAKRPGDHVIPSGVDISIHGDIGLAYREKNTGKCREKCCQLELKKMSDMIPRKSSIDSRIHVTCGVLPPCALKIRNFTILLVQWQK